MFYDDYAGAYGCLSNGGQTGMDDDDDQVPNEQASRIGEMNCSTDDQDGGNSTWLAH